jgi:hypothetical protein
MHQISHFLSKLVVGQCKSVDMVVPQMSLESANFVIHPFLVELPTKTLSKRTTFFT